MVGSSTAPFFEKRDGVFVIAINGISEFHEERFNNARKDGGNCKLISQQTENSAVYAH